MSRARVAELSLLAVAAIWGLTFVLVQDAVAQLPVLAFLAYRFALATALVAVVFGRSLGRLDARGWRSGALMGALLTAGYVLQTAGLTRTSASHAGFITGLFVVLTPLLGALFGQRAGRLAWGSAAVSAVGLWLLCRVGARGCTRSATCSCSPAPWPSPRTSWPPPRPSGRTLARQPIALAPCW